MKVVLVVNDAFSVWHFRKGLIRALVARGVDVVVVSPSGPHVPRLKAIGARHIAVPVFRFMSPLRDLRLCFDLYNVFRREAPDIVHNITAKPNIYGTVAAALAGVPRIVSLVSGLGYAFLEDGHWRRKALRMAISRLYWLSGKLSTKTWFQNGDDLELFVERGLLDRSKAVLIPGSGVNLREYSGGAVSLRNTQILKRELGIDEDARVVLMMVARLSWSKGVQEFVEASRQVASHVPEVHFLLVGPLDPDSPDSVPEAYLRDHLGPNFTWIGFRDDACHIIALADIVTLPSFYREGIPRVLLEAMAMSKPIVTTHNVGCKEVVDDGVNGFLVPIKNASALAEAICEVLGDENLSRAMGRESRQKAQREFDERVVISRVFTELYGLPSVGTDAAKAA